MSLFSRTLDRTTCATVASSISSPPPFLDFLCPALSTNRTTITGISRRKFHHASPNRASKLPTSPPKHMDSFFIQALVQAGSCKEHAKRLSTLRQVLPLTTTHHKPRRKSHCAEGRRVLRASYSPHGSFRPLKKLSEMAKSELKAMVDYYGIEPMTAEDDKPEPDDGLLIWNVGDDHHPSPVKDPSHNDVIERLRNLLEDELASHEDVFNCYKELPSPGVEYLDIDTIRDMLHHLAIVETRDHPSMQRYLSILDDMKLAHIHITSGEWTSAIAFVGKLVRHPTADEVESALHIWKEMEQRAEVQATVVTFNVLFDVAVLAGKYALAESLIQEMDKRKIHPDRHFRTSLIAYWGLRGNGDKVREAYYELVRAEDIVDTSVLNSVITALFRAGEPSAAEAVFLRMKQLYAAKTNVLPTPRNWRQRQAQGKNLTRAGSRHRRYGQKDSKVIKELQEWAPMAPDARTYGLVIRHHAQHDGNIDRVMELLDEMERSSITPDGAVYVAIFHGFASFGGIRYSSWTWHYLERFWAEYMELVQSGAMRTYFHPTAVIAALKAFAKVTDPERTLKAWEEVRALWEPKPEELETVLRSLNKLVSRRRWLPRLGLGRPRLALLGKGENGFL